MAAESRDLSKFRKCLAPDCITSKKYGKFGNILSSHLLKRADEKNSGRRKKKEEERRRKKKNSNDNNRAPAR